MSIAVPYSGKVGNTSLTAYRSGVLLASDDTANTRVWYERRRTAPSTRRRRYQRVATFPGETVTGISGSALLTAVGWLGHAGDERIRFFNGSGGSATPIRSRVAVRGDEAYFGLRQAGGITHGFCLDRILHSDVFEETTGSRSRTGWTKSFGGAAGANVLSPVLSSYGWGVLFENDGMPLQVQPILNVQSVRLTAVSATVKAGHTAVLHGQAGIPRSLERSSRSTSSRAASGDASRRREKARPARSHFNVAGKTATYRAVASTRPGMVQLGYSNADTLTASP